MRFDRKAIRNHSAKALIGVFFVQFCMKSKNEKSMY